MRRSITFENLSEMTGEADRLLKTGYRRSGNWSLGQVCCHLRLTMQGNLDGYPSWMVMLGFPLRPILRRFALPKLLAGNSPTGVPTAGIFVPPNDVDDADEVDQLKQCVVTFLESKQPMHAHPGFGNMSAEEFARFHAAHAAHHFSFLHPRSE